MNNPRYNSGTISTRTTKELNLDYFEEIVKTEFTDGTYLQLKKLSLEAIREITLAIKELVLIYKG